MYLDEMIVNEHFISMIYVFNLMENSYIPKLSIKTAVKYCMKMN